MIGPIPGRDAVDRIAVRSLESAANHVAGRQPMWGQGVHREKGEKLGSHVVQYRHVSRQEVRA